MDGNVVVNEQPQQVQPKPKLPFRTSANPSEVCIKSEAVNSWLLSQQAHKPVKRPSLPTKEYEEDGEEDINIKLLYNFNTLNAW